MRASLALFLALLLHGCPPAARASDAPARVDLGEILLDAREGGVHLRLQRATAGRRALLVATAALDRGARIRVHPAKKPAPLADLVAGLGPSFVAVNGGFYDEQGRAMGLAVKDGSRASRLTRAGGSGVFLVGPGGPRVVHRDAVPKTGVSQALQSIDRVVDAGKSLVGPKASPALDARSAVSVDAAGRVRFISIFSPDAVARQTCRPDHCVMQLDSASSSTGVSLAELARFLVDTGAREALNLDGGYSTSLEARLDGKRLSVVAFGATIQALAARP